MKPRIRAATFALAACLPFATAEALVGDGPVDNNVHLGCVVERLRSELTAEGAKYLSGGTCLRYQGGKEFYRFAWEGEGAYSVKSKQTREALRLTGVGAHVPGHQASGRTIATFTCELDPWLHAGAQCVQLRTSVNGSFTDQQLLDRFQNIQSPYTAQIDPRTRDMLFKQQIAARAKFEEEQRRLAEAKRQQAIAGVSSQTLRAPSTSTTRSGAGSGASVSSDGGTGTGTVSSALKLQGALEQQRQAQASTPSGATQTSVAGRFAGAATAATPSQPANPPAGAGGSSGGIVSQPNLVEPQPNTVVQGVLRVRADIALPAFMPNKSIVEVVQVSAPAKSGTGTTQAPLQRVSVEVATTELAQGTGISMPRGADAAGQWRVRVRYSSSAAVWSKEVLFQYVAYPDVKDQAAAKAGGQLERQALNPQPLPPKTSAGASVQADQRALNPQPEALNAQARPTTNPVATAPNAARSTSSATSVPAVTPDPATANAWKGGTPTGSAPTTSAATRVPSPTTGVTPRADGNPTAAVTRLPAATQRTTVAPDSTFSR